MSHGKITSKMVAQRAGVSQSAVSRVFTQGASVSEHTRAAVLKAANELNYRPNTLARSLITGKSRVIGLVLAYFENQFYPEAVEKFSKALQQRGYHLLIFTASNRDEDIDSVLAQILDHQVDGIVMASLGISSDLAKRCDQAGVPVVLFNRKQARSDSNTLWSVSTDNYLGGQRIAELLVQQQHQRIGHIAGWEGASTQRDREHGFRDYLQAKGLAIHKRTVGNFHYDQASQAAREMFDTDNPPDAVFVASDHMAFAVIDTLRSALGIRIPEDVSVVGFDDVPIAAWPCFNLTTYRQPIRRMVSSTLEALFTHIEDPSASAQHLELQGELIIRGSTQSRQSPTSLRTSHARL